MSIFEPVTKFLFDPTPRLSAKAAFVIFIVVSVIIVDNIFGYSYYYNSGKRIEQLEKINAILKDSATDTQTRIYAENLRNKLIDRTSITEKVVPIIRDINFEKVINNNPGGNRSNFWFHLTSAGFFYLVSITGPLILLFGGNVSLQKLASMILIVIGVLIMGLVLYWIFSFIPPISKSTWLWNYILNFFLQIAIISLAVKVIEAEAR